MKKIIISVLGLSLLGLASASDKTGVLKSSANIEAICTISTDSISFGLVATPLMNQTAQSDMKVKCNNASAYTIDLAYGGIYGTGEGSNSGISTDGNQYKIEFLYRTGDVKTHRIYINDIPFSYLDCKSNGTVQFNSNIGSFYGTSSSGGYIKDIYGACNGMEFNAQRFKEAFKILAGYNYGVMSGMSKGDSLAYSIQVPGDVNKVWNKGNNSYKATGTGISQTIPLVAKIVPDKSGSKYPAPDMYLDTITAIISY